MATIKSFTDLQQSRKLAEILPLESADMEYLAIKENGELVGSVSFVKDDSEVEDSAYSHTYDRIACWSLAALLGVLPESIADDKHNLIAYMSIYKYDSLWVCAYDYEKQEDGNYISFSKESLVDACYEMIIRLHELNLL